MGNNAQIADFAPDAAVFAATQVPEPQIHALRRYTFALTRDHAAADEPERRVTPRRPALTGSARGQ